MKQQEILSYPSFFIPSVLRPLVYIRGHRYKSNKRLFFLRLTDRRR